MSSLELDAIGRLARLAFKNDEPYLFCQLLPLLADDSPEDPEWILGYLQTLVRLGLNRAALDLIGCLASDFSDRPEVAALAESIRSAPPGVIPWTSRKRRFEANLEALADRDLDAAESIRDAWMEYADQFEMHRCTDGNVQLRSTSAVWPPRWLPSLYDHRSVSDQRMSLDSLAGIPPPFQFDGVGLGWEINECFTKTARVFLEASSAIYIVEQRPEAMAVALHIHDWRDLLRDPRVLVFLGDDASRKLASWLESDAYWPLTTEVYSLPALEGERQDPSTSVMGEVGVRREQAAEQLRQQIADRYQGRDAAYWARRFREAIDSNGQATDQPLRILGFTSIHTTFLQYSMRDCLRALERLGHQTELLTNPTCYQQVDPVTALDTQLRFQPDLILVLSHLRDEMTSFAHPAIPSVSWDQDSLPWVFAASRKPNLAWNDFLIGFAASSAPRRFGWSPRHCRFCGMAGSPDTYSSEPLSDDELRESRCDVSYVSHASAPVETEINHAELWLSNEALRPIFRAVVEQLLPGWKSGGSFPGSIMGTILDVSRNLPVPLCTTDLQALNVAVARIGDRAFRQVALNWVADWADSTGHTFFIWGNGWDEHPRLGRYAQGPTKNGHALRCVYQASAINLQLMGYGFIHQRALDGLMAGGFFMGRRCPADTTGRQVQALVEMLDQHNVSDFRDLATVMDSGVRARITTLLGEVGCDPRRLEPEIVDGYRALTVADFAEEIIPHYGEITFASAQEFEQQAERFLSDSQTRARYAHLMREAVIKHHSYGRRMADMLRFVQDGFRVDAGLNQAQLSGEGAALCAPAPVVETSAT